MKTIIMVLTIALMHTIVMADDGSSYGNRYELMKIKQKAHRGSNNRGRVVYEYADDETVRNANTNQIGTVRLDRKSHVREVYIGVDLKRPLRVDKSNGALEIGVLETRQTRPLNRAKIIVDMHSVSH